MLVGFFTTEKKNKNKNKKLDIPRTIDQIFA